MSERRRSEVYITVDRRSSDGALQISINDGDSGYRIAGPKYDGSGTTLLRRTLNRRDVAEIRGYLKRVPADETPAVLPLADQETGHG